MRGFFRLAWRNRSDALAGLKNKLMSKDQVARWQAVKELAQFASKHNATTGYVGAVECLTSALDDSYYLVRKEAVQALGALHTEDAIPELVKLLKDQDHRVRASAAQSLGKLRAPAAFQALLEGVHDAHASVRRACVKTLGELADDRAIDVLIARLDDPQREVRFDAAMALADIGEASLRYLLIVIRSGSKQARIAALNSLEERPSNKARGVLEMVHKDDSNDWEIRRAAAAALRALQEQKAQR